MFGVNPDRGLSSECGKRKDGVYVVKDHDARFLCFRHLTMFLKAVLAENKTLKKVRERLWRR